jgi:xanthine/CO dehydrogenase XdhC/CoxF family maturation factor
MRDLWDLVARAGEEKRAGRAVTLATLVDTEGSTYRCTGARALITASGEVVGLLSGGCLEADVAEHARRIRGPATSLLLTYDLREDDDAGVGLGLGCKGKLTILLERIEPGDDASPLDDLARRDRGDGGGDAASAVIFDGPRRGQRLWYEDGRVHARGTAIDDAPLVEALARACAAACVARRPAVLRDLQAFIEPAPRRRTLAIFGAGPDAFPLVRLASELGFRVALRDHREAALAQRAFAACDERRLVPAARRTDDAAGIHAAAALVMTHGYDADLAILRGLAAADVTYVGVLGPAHRGADLRRDLARVGLSIDHLHSPVGLDLGADAPEAIALSILAEIVAVLHGRDGGFLRDRRGSIHDRAA